MSATHKSSCAFMAALLTGGAITALDVTHTAAWAARNLSLEEIIVTARKREESLQDTPIAVTAFSADSMDRRGMQSIADVARYVPNVSFTAGAGDAGGAFSSSIYIRGIGQNDHLITTDPGVGIYVDGVYFARSVGSIMDLVDFERIEVLRGPQGTLFGKNTIGGAINITSGRPGDELEGSVEVKTGRWNRFDIKGTLTVPLVADKLLSRFSAVYKSADGYGKAVDFTTGEKLGEFGDTDTLAGRAEFLWMATDSLNVSFAIDGTRQRAESQMSRLVTFNDNAGLAQLWNMLVAPAYGSTMGGQYVSPDNYVGYDTGPSGNDLDMWGSSITVDWDVNDNLAVKSITAYRELEAFFTTDQDHSPLPYVQTTNDDNQWQFSQELQLAGQSFDGRLNWLAGAFYFHERAVDRNAVDMVPGLFAALEGLPAAVIPLAAAACPAPFPAPCAGGAGNPYNLGFDLDIDAYNRIVIDNYAAFGQATFSVTDEFSVTAGVRVTKEKKSYTLDHQRTTAGVPVFTPTQVSRDWTNVTPRFGLEYKIDDSVLLYASSAKGFKSGGFNGRPTTQAEVGAFGPESVWAHEIGLKSEWFDRRVILNIAGYFNKYNDIQLTAVQATPEGNIILVTENAGKADVKGFEAELTARVAQGLDVNAAVGHTDFSFKSLNPGATVTMNSRPPHTPSWTFSVGAEYTHQVSNWGWVSLRTDYAYQSSTFMETGNYPVMAQDGYGILNAQIALWDAAERWRLALNGLNLTNKEYRTSGFQTLDSFGLASVTMGQPRSWTLSLRRNF